MYGDLFPEPKRKEKDAIDWVTFIGTVDIR